MRRLRTLLALALVVPLLGAACWFAGVTMAKGLIAVGLPPRAVLVLFGLAGVALLVRTALRGWGRRLEDNRHRERARRAWPAMSDPPRPRVRRAYDLQTPLTAEALAAARDKWTASGVGSYSYRYEVEAFTPYTGPFVVWVQNGDVTRVQWWDGRDEDRVSPQTVEERFAWCERRLANDDPAPGCVVAFDPETGAPLLVRVAAQEGVSDSGGATFIDCYVLHPST